MLYRIGGGGSDQQGRALQADLKAENIQLESEVEETASGPGSFVVVDPDGNPILADQHV